jgi:hypothetical protein
MFGRHHTTPDHELAAVADAFHERLARSAVTDRTDPPRIDPRDLRDRLSAAPAIGLRARLDRPLTRRQRRLTAQRLGATG